MCISIDRKKQEIFVVLFVCFFFFSNTNPIFYELPSFIPADSKRRNQLKKKSICADIIRFINKEVSISFSRVMNHNRVLKSVIEMCKLRAAENKRLKINYYIRFASDLTRLSAFEQIFFYPNIYKRRRKKKYCIGESLTNKKKIYYIFFKEISFI